MELAAHWHRCQNLLKRRYDDRMRLVDYSGKIRLIMLHKPKFAGRSACSTPITCDANSIRALDPGVGASSLESFSTPSASVNHFMAVTEELLNHILALLPILWLQNSKNKLHFGRRERLTTRCHELLHKAESLPEYATEKLLAHQYKAASGGLLLP